MFCKRPNQAVSDFNLFFVHSDETRPKIDRILARADGSGERSAWI